jgi:uncharacterized membrane protein
MNNILKTFLINLIIFLITALTMFLFGTSKEAFVLLFKIWIWISAIIIGYFVILQIQNGKTKDEPKE